MCCSLRIVLIKYNVLFVISDDIFTFLKSAFSDMRPFPTIFKKYKTCTVFLSSYRDTSGSLGEREMLWEHQQQASVSTAFSSSPKLSRVFL